MGDSTRKIDVEKLIAFGDDLVGCLKDEKDVKNLTQHLELSKALQSHCDADSKAVRNLLQDYRKKIDLSKKMADEAKSEAVADAEMDFLQKELAVSNMINTVITNEIGDLEHQGVSVEERRLLLKKLEQEELRTQMKLSMYASVSSIIPNLEDHSKISGRLAATAFFHKLQNGIHPRVPCKGHENKTYKQVQEEAIESKRRDLAVPEANGGVWPGIRTPTHSLFIWARGSEPSSVMEDDQMPTKYFQKFLVASGSNFREPLGTLVTLHSPPYILRYNELEARGLKKHLKRLNAPKHWMLDKLGGAFAPKPSSGPHKSRECLPLILILRNRLKYALTYREVIAILMQRLVLVDQKVRTDKTYPAGFMDVVSIPKTNESFRLLYDTKGRFRLHSIRDEESKFKLCKVRSVQFGQKGIPYINTYDGRTIRYPDPLIKANDTIKFDLEAQKITDFIKFDVGNVVMVTGGRNRGRVGVIKSREKHKGSFETIHVQDATGHEFATRMGNVFTIGKGSKPWVSLPKGKGIKLSIIEEAKKRHAAQVGAAA
ncbi:hypothetical protein RHGRI_015563 [Rhododendron griersonianum]|uniref:KOW domain-containing protein n=2 Tax=Rhododendron TaxID=4346 RepID=A0AAV6KDQ1_9ERIC|nr:hypothetical protein RHGRI_015563 [Rhododendron griersonianum]